jgi:hypothetical protein
MRQDHNEVLSSSQEGLGVGVPRIKMKADFRELDFGEVVHAYKNSKKRVILLDSRGTLLPLSKLALYIYYIYL